jgi:hypothetical protein
VCVAVFLSLELVASFWLWMAACVYVAAHLGIDRAKQGPVSTAKLADSASVFLLDQIPHGCTISALAWFLVRPTWATVRFRLSWSRATGDKVLEAGIVRVAVIFAGGYLIRYLTRNLTAGIKKPGRPQNRLRTPGCTSAGWNGFWW